MSVVLEYIDREIKGLPVARIIEIPEPFDWFGVLSAMSNNYIRTKSKKGYVGLIFPDNFLLIRSFRGAGEEVLVGIAAELAEEYKLQMHFMGDFF